MPNPSPDPAAVVRRRDTVLHEHAEREERARIVRWLRRRWSDYPSRWAVCHELADAIERLDHLKESKDA